MKAHSSRILLDLRSKMVDLNFYDFISFPNRAERDKIRQEFFDFGALRLCVNSVIPQENAVLTLRTFSVKERVEQEINHFNNNMSYLDLAGLQFAHYYNLFVAETDKNRKEYCDALFKQSYRNMCCEIAVVEEKVKDFLRCVYHLDKDKTQNDNKLIQELKREFAKTDYGILFGSAVEIYHTNSDIEKVIKDRNDEIHNETTLLTHLDTHSDVNNKMYYDRIRNCLIAMLELINAFQEFLCKRYPDIKYASCVF